MAEHRRRKRITTTASYAAMLRRMLRAYGSRIASEPAEGLAHLRELEAELRDAVNLGMWQANSSGSRTVNQLAADLGISKQSAHQRIRAGQEVSRKLTQRRPAGTLRRAQPRQLGPGGQDQEGSSAE